MNQRMDRRNLYLLAILVVVVLLILVLAAGD
jgi:hypothetical protein